MRWCVRMLGEALAATGIWRFKPWGRVAAAGQRKKRTNKSGRPARREFPCSDGPLAAQYMVGAKRDYRELPSWIGSLGARTKLRICAKKCVRKKATLRSFWIILTGCIRNQCQFPPEARIHAKSPLLTVSFRISRRFSNLTSQDGLEQPTEILHQSHAGPPIEERIAHFDTAPEGLFKEALDHLDLLLGVE